MKHRSTLVRLIPLLVLVGLAVSCGGQEEALSPYAGMTLSSTQPLSGLEATISFDTETLAYEGLASLQEGLLPVATEIEPGILRVGAIAPEPVDGDLVTVVFSTRDARGTAQVDEMFAVDEADQRTALPTGDITLEYGLMENPAAPTSASAPAPADGPTIDATLAPHQAVDACSVDLRASFADYAFGDVNASGGGTGIGDALAALNIALGANSAPTEFQLYHADLNGSCTVNVTDALMILIKYVNPFLAPALQVAPSDVTLANGETAIALLGNAGRGSLATPSVSTPSGVSATNVSAASSTGMVYRLSASSSASDGQVGFDAGSAGSDSVAVTIEATQPPQGTLAVDVTPNDASWTVRDGGSGGPVEDTGSGDASLTLEPGTYWVQATRSGYTTASDTVTVEDGSTTRVTLTLSQTPDDTVDWRASQSTISGRATVDATPPSGSFRLYNDGNVAGSYTISGIPSWVTLGSTSGNVDPGGSDYDAVSVTFDRCTTVTTDSVDITISGGNDSIEVTLERTCTEPEPDTVTWRTNVSTVTSGADVNETPGGRSFEIFNDGDSTGTYTIDSIPTWATLQPISGSVSSSAGDFDEITVSFDSCTSVGTLDDTITISGGGSSTTLTLERTCVEGPEISVSPSSLDFGDVLVDDSDTASFTVTNVGGGTLEGAVSGLSSPFSVVSGGSYRLGADQSQTVSIRFSPSNTGTRSDTAVFSGGGGANRGVWGTGALPKAPASVTNLVVSSPYRFQYAGVGDYGCGIDTVYGVLGTASSGPTVGPEVAGAPFYRGCVGFEASGSLADEYVVMRRAHGSTSSGTQIGTIPATSGGTFRFVDDGASGGSAEYGVYSVASNGARSATTWSGYGTTPASNLTTYSMTYYNCSGVPQDIQSPVDSLKFFTFCATGRDRVTYAPRGNGTGTYLPVTCNFTSNFSEAYASIQFYDVAWNRSSSSWSGPSDLFNFVRHEQKERTATDRSDTVVEHRRVFARCDAYAFNGEVSGISFSVTDRHVVGWNAAAVVDNFGPAELPPSLLY